MARYTGPRGRRDRRAGVMLSSMRKNPLEKKPYPPGEHGRGRHRQTEYGMQAHGEAEGPLVLRRLREAVQEGLRQGDQDAGRLRREPPQAHGAQDGQRGLPPWLRHQQAAGAPARRARALPAQRPQAQRAFGHLEAGTTSSRSRRRAGSWSPSRTPWRTWWPCPPWLEADHDNFTGRLLHTPGRDEIDTPVEEQLIIEFYSR